MDRILASHEQQLGSLRVFSLTIALLLITFALAGVRLESPAKIQPLGIPLEVTRPDLLTIALVLASVYSLVRFIYFALLAQPSPVRARSRLLRGSRVNTTTRPASLDEFERQVAAEMERYFPRLPSSPVKYEVWEVEEPKEGYRFGLRMSVPRIVQWAARFEDIDFLAPIWANGIALGLWVYATLWKGV